MKVNLKICILLSMLNAFYVTKTLAQAEDQKEAYNLLYNLEKNEPFYRNIYNLHAAVKSAYEAFTSHNWADPDEYIELSYRWYNLIVNMYEKFSGPQIQEIRERYEDGILATQCRAGTRQIMEGTDTLYLQEYNPDIIHDPDYTYINGRRIDSVKTEAMCDLFKITLAKPQLKVTTPTPGTLRIYGDYVRARDISALFKQSDNISALEIYALNRFIVDDNLEIRTDKQFPIFITSPIWDILTADEIPEEARKPYQNNAWPPTIHIASTVSGSSFFGIGMQFRQMEGHLGITISRARSSGYVTLYQLVPPEEVKVARTAFGLGFKEPNPAVVGVDYHEAMNEYAKYLLLSRDDRFRNTLLTEFFTKIYTYPNFKTSLFNTLGFARELSILEEHFLSLLRDNVPLRTVYETVDQRFRDYSLHPKSNEGTLEYIETRKYVSTALLSKTDVLTSDEGLVVDLVKFLSDSVKESINMGDVVQRERTKKIMMYNKDMKEGILEEIIRVKEFIDKEVMPQLELTNEQLDASVERLLNLIMNLKKETKRIRERREQEKKRLSNVQGLKLASSLVSAITGSLLALGTMGGGAFIWIGGITLSANAIISTIEDPTVTEQMKMSEGMQNVQYFIQSKAQTLDKILEIIDDKNPEVFTSLKNDINATKNQLLEGVDNAPFEEVDKLLLAKEKELKDMSSPPSGALDLVHELQRSIKIARVSTGDMYLKYYRNDSALQILSDAANKKDPDEIKAINQYERNVHALLVPAIKYLRNYTMEITNMSETKSLARIDVKRWKANDVLEDVHFRIEQFAAGWHEGKMMLLVIDKLKRGLDLVFGLLSRIAAYLQYVQLIDYIANINSVAFETSAIANPGILDIITNLKYIARYNTAIAQYKMALNSYRLFAFPFATMLDAVNNFDILTDVKETPTTREIAYNAELQLSYLQLKMSRYKNDIIREEDVEVLEADFDGSSTRRPIFFSWNLRDTPDVLEKLFSGEPVKLHADIKQGVNRNAVKFKRIGLRFQSNRSKGQSQIDNALRAYDLKMTHSGESYFRCNKVLYKVKSTEITLMYSFEKNDAGEPTVTGASYKKLMNGDYLLSPYTEWTVKIVSESNNYAALQKLKGKRLTLELVGYGQYIQESSVCDKNLYKYYETVD